MSNDRTVVFQLPQVVSGQLNCLQGSVVGQSWKLSAGTFIIGRQDGCDLHLPNEPGVSKVHAKIVAEGDAYFIVDAESRNGTILNNQVVQRAELFDGAEIQICGCRLRFTKTAGTGAIDVKNAPLAQPPPAQAMPPAATPPPQAMPPPAMPPPPVAEPTSPPMASAQPPPAPVTEDISRQRLEAEPPVMVPAKTGSIWPSFFAGLFLVLVVGGATAGALIVLDEGDPVDTTSTAETASPDTAVPNAERGAVDASDAKVAVDAKGEGAPADPAAADAGAKPTNGEGTDSADHGEGKASDAIDDKAATGDKGDAADDNEKPADVAATDKPAADKPADKPEDDAAAAEPEAVPEAVEQWVKVTVRTGRKTPIRALGSGRVKDVAVSNGDSVKKGATVVQLQSTVKPSEIATARESVSTLESIAESSDGAKEALQEERARLKKLLAQQRGARVSSPTSGTVSGLSVKAGDRVRSRQVVGFVEGGTSEASALVTSKTKLRAKQKIEVKLPSGKLKKVRIKKVKREGSKQRLTFDAKSVPRGSEVKVP